LEGARVGLAHADLVREHERFHACHAWVRPDLVTELGDVVRQHAHGHAGGYGRQQPVHRGALDRRREERPAERVEIGVATDGVLEAAMELGQIEGADLELGNQRQVRFLDRLRREVVQRRQGARGTVVEGPDRVHHARVERDGPNVAAHAPACFGAPPSGAPPSDADGASSLRYQVKNVKTKGAPNATKPETFMIAPASAWSSSGSSPYARTGMLA